MTTTALPSDRANPARQALLLLRAYPREAVGGAMLLAAAGASLAALAGTSGAVPVRPEAVAGTSPKVQEMTPFAVRQVAPDEALKLNAAVPLAGGPNPAAAPFVLKADSQTYGRALECLTQAIYYEAAREPEEGQRAVAQVVLNRVRHPAYPASVCGVVYEGAERPTGCQFSFTCDGSLAAAPERSYWDRARRIAAEALNGAVAPEVGNATHYHANYVLPYLAPTLVKNAVVGAHIFYRWAGTWGQPASFTQRWNRHESDPKLLRSAALAAEARYAALQPADTSAQVAKAKQQLPPELAKLVDAEIGAKGSTRVTMRIKPVPRIDVAGKSLDEMSNEGSSSLKWGLTGGTTTDEAAQAPLGRKPSSDGAAASGAAN